MKKINLDSGQTSLILSAQISFINIIILLLLSLNSIIVASNNNNNNNNNFDNNSISVGTLSSVVEGHKIKPATLALVLVTLDQKGLFCHKEREKRVTSFYIHQNYLI